MKSKLNTIVNDIQYFEIYNLLLEKIVKDYSAKKTISNLLKSISFTYINDTIYLIELKNEFYLQVALITLNANDKFAIIYKFHEYTGNTVSLVDKNDIKIIYTNNDKSLNIF